MSQKHVSLDPKPCSLVPLLSKTAGRLVPSPQVLPPSVLGVPGLGFSGSQGKHLAAQCPAVCWSVYSFRVPFSFLHSLACMKSILTRMAKRRVERNEKVNKPWKSSWSPLPLGLCWTVGQGRLQGLCPLQFLHPQARQEGSLME